MVKVTRGILKVRSMACVDKMLSNDTCLETIIQRLFDGLIFVEKGRCACAAHDRNAKVFTCIHWRKFKAKCLEKKGN